jgi:pimeloyl-ACP methyl ester carboxylesterase
LFAKKTQMDQQIADVPAETVRAIKAPTLLIIGDSDLVRPEHAVEMFRLLGGGVFGDTPAGLPNSQLAVLPGTSHVSLVNRADLLIPMITSFLDAPMPGAP